MIFPGGVFAVPQEITVDIGPLARNADLVTVEVAGLLSTFAVCVGPVVDLCQGFVRTAHTLRRDWKFHVHLKKQLTYLLKFFQLRNHP